MELVHKMLSAAMADDGVEDDVVKEEYGKSADDTLASLRAKLEEARRREGKEGLAKTEGHTDDDAEEKVNGSREVQYVVGHGEPESAPSESAQKVCHLRSNTIFIRVSLIVTL